MLVSTQHRAGVGRGIPADVETYIGWNLYSTFISDLVSVCQARFGGTDRLGSRSDESALPGLKSDSFHQPLRAQYANPLEKRSAQLGSGAG